MIMYHGTSFINAKSIFSDGKIKKDVEVLTYGPDAISPTTPGYIYLTSDITKAIYYGRLAGIQKEEEDVFIIFKMNVDESLLEADKDEFKYVVGSSEKEELYADPNDLTLSESLEHLKCARIRKDINFDETEVKFVQLPHFFNNSDKEAKEHVLKFITPERHTEEEKIHFEKHILQWRSVYNNMI